MPRNAIDIASGPTTDTSATNLPLERSRLVGRAHDLAALARFSTARLITIHGAAGLGKTRLARRHGRVELETRAPDGGVWFCDLSEAHTRDQLVAAVANVLGVSPHQRSDGAERRLEQALAARRSTLLILDNFEQLVDHAPATLGRWLDAAPTVRFVVTSRESLGLDGERRWELGPLGEADAVELFLDRAACVRPGADLSVGDDQRAAIAEIVRTLEGNPLAIELAAGAVDTLSPAQIRDRIGDVLSLRSDRRDGQARHSTLRAAIAWSWQLLTEPERAVLAQCAVFRRTFSLEAAEQVVRLQTSAPPLLEVLRALRKKSMLQLADETPVRREDGTHAPDTRRYRLYASVQTFAAEVLAQLGASGEAEQRHAAYFLALAERCADQIGGADDREALAAFARELENLLTASVRLRVWDPAAAARLAVGMDALLAARGQVEMRISLLDQAVSDSANAPDAAQRARVLYARAGALRDHGRYGEAMADLTEARAIAAHTGQVALEAEAAARLGKLECFCGSIARSRHYAQEAAALGRANGALRAVALAESVLGDCAIGESDYAAAQTHFVRSVALARQLGDRRLEATELQRLARCAHALGDDAEVRPMLARALAILREHDDRASELTVLRALAIVLIDAGELREAEPLVDRALQLHRDLGIRIAEELALLLRANIQIELGAEADVFTACAPALARCDELETASLRPWVLFYEGLHLLLQGHILAAGRCLEQAMTAPRAEAQLTVCVLSTLGALRAMDNRIEEAESLFARAYAEVDGIVPIRYRPVIPLFEGLLDISRARRARATGDDAQAEQHARRPRRWLEAEPTPRSLVARLAARLLEQQLARDSGRAGATPQRGLRIGATGHWFQLSGGPAVTLVRRPALAGLLAHLAGLRVKAPGRGESWRNLLAAGWPGQRVQPDSGHARVRTAIRTLRKFGLQEVLLTVADGYVLDPDVPIDVDTAS